MDLNFKIPLKKKDLQSEQHPYVSLSPLEDETDGTAVKLNEAQSKNQPWFGGNPNKSSLPGKIPKKDTTYYQNYYVPITQTMPPPPPPPPPPPGTEPVHLEEKATYKRRNTLMLNQDQEFPDDLKSLLRPLHCQLCKVTLNSVISARTHYESKNHEKKINGWLQEWAQKTGAPSPKKFKIVRTDVNVGPNAYHCDVCDLALTSVQHAQQHYSGRKHNAAISGRQKPGGSGYYSNDGKWIRQYYIIISFIWTK